MQGYNNHPTPYPGPAPGDPHHQFQRSPSGSTSRNTDEIDTDPPGPASAPLAAQNFAVGPGPDGLFRCDFTGCDKSFTRKDHLIRHSANHTTSNFFCQTCKRPFKRFDLLQRHEKRQICTSGENSRGGAHIKRRRSDSMDSGADESIVMNQRRESRMSIGASGNGHGIGIPHGNTNGVENGGGGGPLSASLTSSGYSVMSSTSPTRPNPATGPGPESGYGGLQTIPQGQRPAFPVVQNNHLNQHFPIQQSSNSQSQSYHTQMPLQPHTQLTHINHPVIDFSTHPFLMSPPYEHEPSSASTNTGNHPGLSIDMSSSSQSQASTSFQPPDTGFINPLDLVKPFDLVSFTNGSGAFKPDEKHNFTFGLWPAEQWEGLLQDSLAPPWNETLVEPDMLWNNLTPRMQESAERGALSLANAALLAKLQLAFPGLEFNLRFVNESIEHYWSQVAPTFPFIHRGTFNLDEAPTELILMMCIVGSMHMPISPSSTTTKQPRDFGPTVQSIRGILVQHCGLDMPITTLQAFCLCHVWDTWYGTSETQFIAQCMWPIMVAHSRKKGIGVVGRAEDEEEETWAAWAKDEERRRAAFCVLLIDTQLSFFWNQHVSRQLSIFAHYLSLPCPRAQWDALSSSDWIRARGPPINSVLKNATSPSGGSSTAPSSTGMSKRARSGYMPGLHPEFQVNVVTEGYSTAILTALASAEMKIPVKIDLENRLGTELILIGLMAVAWDCRTRGGMGIRFREGSKHWRAIVLSAVIDLRAQWEESVSSFQASIGMRDLRDNFAIAIISILSDIPMLQVAAGATTVSGAQIGPRQYGDAKRRLRLWAKTDDAWTTVWQSTRYLSQALFQDWGLYTPWAVFLTTLVLWAYSQPSTEHTPSANPRLSTDLFMKNLLASPVRIEPQKTQEGMTGLTDLVVSAAGLLDDAAKQAEAMEGGDGGHMCRDMAGLLWRLVGGGGLKTEK